MENEEPSKKGTILGYFQYQTGTWVQIQICSFNEWAPEIVLFVVIVKNS